MQRSGDHIQEATAALTLPTDPQILDLCMAPGGYTASALKYNPGAKVSAITLPREQGGHEVIVGYGWRDPRVEVHFSDITLFATEFGVTDIPKDHPDFRSLSTQRPWADKEFDLVFCDGQVLRTHDRLSYRQRCEAMRLSCSQLILAMQRIKYVYSSLMLPH